MKELLFNGTFTVIKGISGHDVLITILAKTSPADVTALRITLEDLHAMTAMELIKALKEKTHQCDSIETANEEYHERLLLYDPEETPS